MGNLSNSFDFFRDKSRILLHYDLEPFNRSLNKNENELDKLSKIIFFNYFKYMFSINNNYFFISKNPNDKWNILF